MYGTTQSLFRKLIKKVLKKKKKNRQKDTCRKTITNKIKNTKSQHKFGLEAIDNMDCIFYNDRQIKHI